MNVKQASAFKLRLLPVFICIVFLHAFAFGQSEIEGKLDSMISTVFADENGPGGVVLVSKSGQPIYHKAFGKSNVELGTIMTTSNVFQIGSMTKQFTAVAIVLLEEAGKLAFTDPVSKYLPDYPNGEIITIHHLLTHTSGIKDFTKMKVINEIATKNLSPAELVDVFKNEPVNSVPGEKFEYNNSGYVLLGHLVEVISGQTYEEFIRSQIFEKLGMSHSFYASDEKIIPFRAYGYHQRDDQYRNKRVISYAIPFASGSLMSTSSDLNKWQMALKSPGFLKAESLQKVFGKSKLNDGTPLPYGYGWHLREYDGVPSFEHGGSIFGYKSMAVYLPLNDIYVVGLSNCDCNSPTKLITDIAELFRTQPNP